MNFPADPYTYTHTHTYIYIYIYISHDFKWHALDHHDNFFQPNIIYIYIYIYAYTHTYTHTHTHTRIHIRPVSWGYNIHRLHLCWGVRPHPVNEFPGYNIKISDGEDPALKIWGMWSIPPLPLLPGPLWPGMVVFDWVLSMDQIEQAM